jgi:CspA family cold shock protein
MAIGTVKFFDVAKGFGFIVPEDGGKDIFVHKTAVERAGMADLAKGLNISYEMEIDSNGAVQAAKLELRPQVAVPVTANNGPSPRIVRGRRKSVDGYAAREDLRKVTHGVHHAIQTGSSRPPKGWDKSGELQRNYDRYCELARNAGDDAVTRENYWQHAEHFLRMLNGSAA